MVRKILPTLDLFCGAGGSSRGAIMAGATPVAAVDMWKPAADTYKLNFPAATVYQTRTDDLSPERIMEDVGTIDLILASPECTSHSVARGSRPPCEATRDTAFEVIRFADVMRPRWVVVENVLQMRRWHRFHEWYRELGAIGYNLQTGVLDAQHYDTPQSRRRVFIVGDLKSIPSLPRPGVRTAKTVASIIGTGEPSGKPWPFSPLSGSRRASATIMRAERAIGELGHGTPFIMVYYGTDGAGGFQKLDRPLRTVTTLDRFAYVKLNGAGYEMRMLQPPELAAAMGFPECHRWDAPTRRDLVKLIGNAVAPPVMRAIVEALVGASNGEW